MYLRHAGPGHRGEARAVDEGEAGLDEALLLGQQPLDCAPGLWVHARNLHQPRDASDGTGEPQVRGKPDDAPHQLASDGYELPGDIPNQSSHKVESQFLPICVIFDIYKSLDML